MDEDPRNASYLLTGQVSYPRPGASPPTFAKTPMPVPIPEAGTVVGLLDLPGNKLSRDGLALRQALSTLGIPSRTVSRAEDLGNYRVVMLSGDLSASMVTETLTAQVRTALGNGTTVLLVSPSSPRLYELAGITQGGYSATRQEFSLAPSAAAEPSLATLSALSLRTVQLGSSDGIVGRGYQIAATTTALSTFEDRSVALLRKGRLYVLGLKPQYYTSLLLGNRFGLSGSDTNRHYVEGDLLPLFLRDLYRSVVPSSRVRQAAPNGKRAAVILTHDTDSPNASVYVRQFMDVQRRYGVRATYLVPTMPYEGTPVGWVYKDELLATLNAALAEGHDVGSHSFGHLPDFATIPRVRGNESAANYLPRYTSSTSGGTKFGEIYISKWLLQTDLGVPITTFRSGHLAFYSGYYEDLAQAGYLRSTVRPSGIVRTNFPYRALASVNDSTVVSDVIEYPLAISDRSLTDSNVALKVDEWLTVVDRNQITQAPTVLLLHPTSRPAKLEALSRFLAGLSSRDVWVGDLRTFAAFYEGQGF